MTAGAICSERELTSSQPRTCRSLATTPRNRTITFGQKGATYEDLVQIGGGLLEALNNFAVRGSITSSLLRSGGSGLSVGGPNNKWSFFYGEQARLGGDSSVAAVDVIVETTSANSGSGAMHLKDTSANEASEKTNGVAMVERILKSDATANVSTALLRLKNNYGGNSSYEARGDLINGILRRLDAQQPVDIMTFRLLYSGLAVDSFNGVWTDDWTSGGQNGPHSVLFQFPTPDTDYSVQLAPHLVYFNSNYYCLIPQVTSKSTSGFEFALFVQKVGDASAALNWPATQFSGDGPDEVLVDWLVRSHSGW